MHACIPPFIIFFHFNYRPRRQIFHQALLLIVLLALRYHLLAFLSFSSSWRFIFSPPIFRCRWETNCERHIWRKTPLCLSKYQGFAFSSVLWWLISTLSSTRRLFLQVWPSWDVPSWKITECRAVIYFSAGFHGLYQHPRESIKLFRCRPLNEMINIYLWTDSDEQM